MGLSVVLLNKIAVNRQHRAESHSQWDTNAGTSSKMKTRIACAPWLWCSLSARLMDSSFCSSRMQRLVMVGESGQSEGPWRSELTNVPHMSSVKETSVSTVARPAPTRRIGWRGIVALLVLAGGVVLASQLYVELALWRANVCLEAREHQAAWRWLRQVSWLRPRSAELHFLMARTNRRLERFADVEQELKRAAELGWPRQDLEREQWLAQAQTGQFQLMRQHWSELFRDARSDGPEISHAFVISALSRFQIQDALKVIAVWKTDYPNDPEPYFLEGRIAGVGLKWKEAEDAYRQAEVRAPERIDIQEGLIEALMKQLKFSEADTALQSLLRQDPDNFEAMVNLADCQVRLGELEQARETLDSVLKQEPDQYRALVLIGQLESAAGQPQQAVDALRRAVDQHPEDAEVRYLYGRALRAAGREAEAMPHLAFREQAREPLLRLNQATNELVANPANQKLRYEVAELTWRWKSHDEGATWLRSLLDFNPSHQAAHALLARHYELKHDTKKAEQHRQLAGSVEFHE